MEYYVYQLIDPRDESIFYVGKGCRKRMYQHVESVKYGQIPNGSNTKLGHKIKKILSLELKVKYKKVFLTENKQDAYNKEKELIEEIGLKNLCNLTDGGEGGFSSEQQKLNNKKSQEKQKFLRENNPEWVDKRSKAISEGLKEAYGNGSREKTYPFDWTNKKHLAESIVKMSKSKKGQIPWNKGIARSEETKRKISESLKGNIPWNKGRKNGAVDYVG